jgi:uncharacterized protein (DUF433 family)
MTRLSFASATNLACVAGEVSVGFQLPPLADTVARALTEWGVNEDPQILGGTPVFRGTRVPIDTVLACIDRGIERARIAAAYPSVTDAHIKAAQLFRAENPLKSAEPRPRRPIGQLIARRIVRDGLP